MEARALAWRDDALVVLDQRVLPERVAWLTLTTPDSVAAAIRDMAVRGAPAIGAAAAFGLALASPRDFDRAADALAGTRPTARDLFHAIETMRAARAAGEDLVGAAQRYADAIVAACERIGVLGEAIVPSGGRLLTHCNAGALATVDVGTALAPMRRAHAKGRRLFVLADETRPRLQGRLTAWELANEGIPHALIADNAAGHFLSRGDVDAVIVGADRVAANGDFANKIGTYEKAVLAARHGVPFYVAAPLSTFDAATPSGRGIAIEERDAGEVAPAPFRALNPAFDVTPADLVTAFVTEAGVVKPADVRALVDRAKG